MRLLAPFRRTLYAGGPLTLSERGRWLRTFHAWKKAAFSEVLPSHPKPDTVAILLSCNRPQNIDIIVRLLLRTPSIAKVIVSNNNPRYRMCDWLSIRDPRLVVIEQSVSLPCHLRYGIAARETEFHHFLVVDDDLFLRSSQMEALCSALRKDPSRPHGITGMVYDSWRGMMYHNMNQRTQKVDALNRVYAFTSAHVEGFRQLLRETGFKPTHTAWRYSYWDDLFLSFSGGKPQVCFVGKYLDCPTEAKAGIGVWTEPGFFRHRLPLLLLLRRLRPHQG